MQKFTTISLVLALALGAGAKENVRPNFDLSKFQYRGCRESVFEDAGLRKVREVDNLMQGVDSRHSAPYFEANPVPVVSLGPNEQSGTIDGPGGELWYFTSDLQYEEIPPHDDIAFTDLILRHYKFDIYDSKMQHVGSVEDDMVYSEKEVRVVACELLPFVSRNFFNNDDNLEVVISLTINAEVGHNNYRTVVYSLGAPKEDGKDKPLMTYDRLIGDVSEAPSSDSSDNYYLTFLEDVEPSVDESEDMTFWEYLCSMKLRFTIYKKAGSAGAPQVVYTRDVPLCRIQGDQENSAFMFTMEHNGYLYYVLPTYAEPYFNEYNDPINEETTMRNPNVLNVEFLRMEEDGLKLQYTTSIPVTKVDDERVPASFFSVGDLRYREDVMFSGYSTPADRAALIITRQDYLPSSDSYVTSYYVYDHEGKLLRTLFEGADSSLAMADVEGFEPQQLFISQDQYGYEFSFVDLYSGKRVLRFSSMFEIDPDSDPESLTANMVRYPDAEDGYVYVNEMRTPLVIMSEPDENGVTEEIDNRIRFMWINKDGSFRRIDEVSMGKNVRYAQSYLETKALEPTAYHSDDNHEYMMLIKRATTDEKNNEELLIGQAVSDELPEGKTLLLLGPDAEKGILKGIFADFYSENPLLAVRYVDQSGNYDRYSMDFYTLPLDKGPSGIKIQEIAKGKEQPIMLVDGTVKADGLIRVYSADGALVASGNSSVALDKLGSGIYIVTASGASRKIAVK